MNKTELIPSFQNNPITTERTVLKLMSNNDINDFLSHAAYSMSVNNTELEDIFRRKCEELLSSEDEVILSIRLNDNNMYIGYFELKGLDDCVPEIGIDLIADFQRQGIGLEVCRAVIDYIFNNTDIALIRYNCFRSNVASLKLAQKLRAIQVEERVLFEKLQNAGLSQETIDESVAFDLIVHEIRKQDW